MGYTVNVINKEVLMSKQMSFGHLLRLYRESKGMSQRQVAMKYGRLQGKPDGATPSVVAQLEIGHRHPSKRTIDLLVASMMLSQEQQNNLLLSAGYAPNAEEYVHTIGFALEQAGINGQTRDWLITLVRNAPYLSERDKREIGEEVSRRIRECASPA